MSLPPEYLDRLIDRATPPVDAQQRETQIMAGRWLALRRLQRELASQQVCERTGLPATALLLLESGLADAALAPASAWRTLDSCLSNGPTDMLVGQVIAIALGQTNHHDSAIVSAIEDDLSFTLMRGSAAIAADELLIKSPQSALRRSRRPRLRLRGCSGWGGLLLTLGSLITMSIFTLLIVSSCSLASLGALAILPAPAIPVAPTAGTGGFTGSDILSCRTASGGLVGCASLALPAPPTPASLIGPPHEHATLLASVGLASPNVLRGAGSWPTAAENSRPVRHPPGALDERARWNLLRYTGAGRLAVVLLSTP